MEHATAIRFRRNALLDATSFAASDGRGGLIMREPAHMSPRRYYVRSESLSGCDYASFGTLRGAKDAVRDAVQGSGSLLSLGRTTRY